MRPPGRRSARRALPARPRWRVGYGRRHPGSVKRESRPATTGHLDASGDLRQLTVVTPTNPLPAVPGGAAITVAHPVGAAQRDGVIARRGGTTLAADRHVVCRRVGSSEAGFGVGHALVGGAADVAAPTGGRTATRIPRRSRHEPGQQGHRSALRSGMLGTGSAGRWRRSSPRSPKTPDPCQALRQVPDAVRAPPWRPATARDLRLADAGRAGYAPTVQVPIRCTSDESSRFISSPAVLVRHPRWSSDGDDVTNLR